VDKSRGDRPRIATQSVIHIEVASDYQGENRFYQVLVSLPSRESMYTRTWLVSKGGIDDAQMADLSATVAAFVSDAVYTRDGVQQRLSAMD